MNRFLTLLAWDIRLQARQGIYYAALVVILVWLALFTQLPDTAVGLFVPLALFIEFSVFGVYFMAAMLFLEKSERVLQALVVTPLPRIEYLASKIITLTAAALIAATLVVWIGYGANVNWFLLLCGAALNSWLLILVGFLIAARFDAINEFLIPSILYMAPSALPLLDYYGIWEHPLLYLVPTQAAMILFEGAVRPIPTWEMIYSFIYLSVACVVATWWALAVFDRFIVRGSWRR